MTEARCGDEYAPRVAEKGDWKLSWAVKEEKSAKETKKHDQRGRRQYGNNL